MKPLSRNRTMRRAVHVLFLTAALLLLVVSMVSAAGSAGWSQCANNNLGAGHLGECDWINGIVQGNKSLYYEGMSNPQRIWISGISTGAHTVHFSYQFTKGGIHAYDFLTSYAQAQAASQLIGGFPMTLNECVPNSGAGWTTAQCTALRNGPKVTVSIPDDTYVSGVCNPSNTANCTTLNKITAYEALFGDRTLDIWGAGITVGATPMTCTHSVAAGADTGDSDVTCALTFTVGTAGNVLIELAGHVSLGGADPVQPGVGWGTGLGAGSISGGPYHFSALDLDGQGGSQDNQITSAAIPARASIVTQISQTAASAPPWPNVTDQATVSGSAGTPTGSVNFTMCGPYTTTPATACNLSDPAATAVTQKFGWNGTTWVTPVPASPTGMPLNASGVATSASFPVGGTGVWCFQADYIHTGTTYQNVSSTTVTAECVTVTSPTAVTLSNFKAAPADQRASGRVTLNWTTATELNTAGFNLYRSEHSDGPYIRVNAQLIPAAVDSLTGGKYQYVDTNVTPGKTYYYQLEDVELNGTSMRHPALAVTVESGAPMSGALLVLGVALGALIVVVGRIVIVRRRG